MKPPLLVTAAIIINQKKVLLVKRARNPFKGYWSFIGGCGAFEHTSNPEEVVKKEVYDDIRCLFYPTFWGYSYQELDIKSVVLYFYGNISGNLIINPEYVSDYKWILIEEAVNLELAFDHQDILKKFLRAFPDGIR